MEQKKKKKTHSCNDDGIKDTYYQHLPATSEFSKKELKWHDSLNLYEPKLEIKESTICEIHDLKIEPCFDGVFTTVPIPPQQAVCRYYGKLQRYEDMKKDRVNMYDINYSKEMYLDGSVYIEEIRRDWEKKTWNFGPFLNDMYPAVAKNNCYLGPCFYDKAKNAYYYILISKKRIKIGEELCWSYSETYWKQFNRGDILGFEDLNKKKKG